MADVDWLDLSGWADLSKGESAYPPLAECRASAAFNDNCDDGNKRQRKKRVRGAQRDLERLLDVPVQLAYRGGAGQKAAREAPLQPLQVQPAPPDAAADVTHSKAGPAGQGAAADPLRKEQFRHIPRVTAASDDAVTTTAATTKTATTDAHADHRPPLASAGADAGSRLLTHKQRKRAAAAAAAAAAEPAVTSTPHPMVVASSTDIVDSHRAAPATAPGDASTGPSGNAEQGRLQAGPAAMQQAQQQHRQLPAVSERRKGLNAAGAGGRAGRTSGGSLSPRRGADAAEVAAAGGGDGGTARPSTSTGLDATAAAHQPRASGGASTDPPTTSVPEVMGASRQDGIAVEPIPHKTSKRSRQQPTQHPGFAAGPAPDLPGAADLTPALQQAGGQQQLQTPGGAQLPQAGQAPLSNRQLKKQKREQRQQPKEEQDVKQQRSEQQTSTQKPALELTGTQKQGQKQEPEEQRQQQSARPKHGQQQRQQQQQTDQKASDRQLHKAAMVKAAPPTQAPARLQPAASSLISKMQARLQGGHFRFLNEALYTQSGDAALELMGGQPELFEQYHEGFRHQVKGWPRQPIDVAASWLGKLSPSLVVADFGCGDAKLAKVAKQVVHSFDLVAHAPGVIACNMAHVPLADASVDVAVFSLALMGTDYGEFLAEAARVIRTGGWLWIAEVRSRFAGPNNTGEDFRPFLRCVQLLGFKLHKQDAADKMFVVFELRKIASAGATTAGNVAAAADAATSAASSGMPAGGSGKGKAQKSQGAVAGALRWPELKPCIYKRR